MPTVSAGSGRNTLQCLNCLFHSDPLPSTHFFLNGIIIWLKAFLVPAAISNMAKKCCYIITFLHSTLAAQKLSANSFHTHNNPCEQYPLLSLERRKPVLITYRLQAGESFLVQEAVIADKIGFRCTAEELGIGYLCQAAHNSKAFRSVRLLET